MNKNVFTVMSCDDNFDESSIILFGAPFDGTVSFRPGSRFAPNNIRNDSYGIETYSPYLNLDLDDYKYCDVGDIEFPFGNKEKVLEMIYNKSLSIVESGKKPFMIGGEHLVSYSNIKAVFEKYSDLRIIHLDAHVDLRDDYMGEKFSHATVLRRVWDLVGDNKIFQFGIRSGTKEEFNFSKKHTSMNKFTLLNIDRYIEELSKYPIYITIDLDVFDPSVLPGTGTPEAGGIIFNEFVEFIKKISMLNIVGADVVELAPNYDDSGISNNLASKVVRETLLIMSK